MSRKKKRKFSSRRNRPVLMNKAKNGSLGGVTFDQWKSQMPHWLKKAEAAVESGQRQEAAEILSPQRIKQELKTQSGLEGILIIYGMAKVLNRMGQAEEAKKLYKEILKICPLAAVYNQLARICEKSGNLNEAVQHLSMAMQLAPNDASIWGTLGNSLIHLGQTQKGMEYVRKAVEKLPENSNLHSNLLFRLHGLPNLDRQEIFDEHKKWAKMHAPTSIAKTDHNNIPDPDRKLRIGYISPDYCAHPVLMFFDPILESHHREEVEVYGYGDIEIPDIFTEQIKNKFDQYRNICGIDDKSTADMIEQDQIDILVDLAGHTGGSRLRTLAYRPAPIQATYLGYFDTTGMEQVDYFITDERMSPQDTQCFHSESLLYLPNSCLCYKPLTATPVAEAPMIKNGYVTFGMFGNASKVNPFNVSLWASVLKKIPNSRMMFMFRGGDDEEVTEHYKALFERFGIPRSRLQFHGRILYIDYLMMYNDVDIILDTYPYNGGTTTCDALWMGVPVVSLLGQHHFSRVGLSILTDLQLEFFVASTPDEFVSKAAALAAKPDALAKIRETMRDRMSASTLCDKDMFTKNIEKAYRNMWKKWCNTKTQSHIKC